MLSLMKTIVVLAVLLVATAFSEIRSESESSVRAKRYVNFSLLRPYVSPSKNDQLDRPIILQTRESRDKLNCILNLRSFELCRARF
ncbi:hypothetical protein V3C99_008501 [Haemonchus contortus]|nr:unnamed protein product [Haemonchus contortus]